MIFHDVYDLRVDTEMRQAEQILKQIAAQNPKSHLELPHEMEYSSDYLAQIKNYDTVFYEHFREALKEDSFFQSNADCELYFHLRYLPCMWHSHTFFEIACVMEGSCINYISAEKLEMQAGDVCIIAPGTRHAISAFSDDCVLINIILRASTFETAFFETLSENNILSNFFMQTLYQTNPHPYLLFRTNRDMEALNYVGYAYEEYLENRLYKERMLNSIISAFFIMLLRKHSDHLILPALKGQKRKNNLMDILKYLQEHFKTATLTEVAQRFNYSERQIQRLFKTSMGMSFSDCLLKLKMDYATHLLEDPNMTVSRVAEELGYSDTSNFRHVFVKYYGISPAEYRKSK